ncbi:uncharacterized protein LOC126678537 [Mercurialis annua]|uniref:uncharacterized protein LOC126678537 n=1 Tax=Mercurialis annua TaxID=3986 RepID=UPI00215EE822|nr:uncharacterized protein LOC126678537 [Mercurialis annua]
MAEMNNICVHVPVRSISLPSRLHPNSLKIDSLLTNLKSSPNSLQTESIQIALTRLAELFVSIDELTTSPQTQKSFHLHQSNQVEDILDGSIGLIDICSSARDMFLNMQQHIQDLQSAFRRRGKDSTIERNIQDYITFRKKTKKDIAKSIRILKRFERKTASIINEEHHLIKVIKEAHAMTVTIFQSVFLFLSMPITKTSTSRWSMISKLVQSGFVGSDKDDDKMVNEVGRVDIGVSSISGEIRKSNGKLDVQEMQERLKKLDACTQEIEAKLDCLFRCMIQNRVSLLNLITP